MTPTYNRSDIIGWMAYTIEVLSYMAWCDAWDEADDPENRPDDCVSAGSGEDWFDIAPMLDLGEQEDHGINWREEAAILYGRIAQAWGVDPFAVLWHNSITSSKDAERWAHYAVMSAVGHGVCWEDSHEALHYSCRKVTVDIDLESDDIPSYPGEWPTTEGA